ncbi:MAG: hypothetical protein IH956_03340 [Chloroflexi bacterium]|nr:hypothetical protein [Chloroflexota bacterium]
MSKFESDVEYLEPKQGYDWSISNYDDGKAKLIWSGNGCVMYIGEMKAQLRHLIKRLDKAADEWNVPNNLDTYGRTRWQA